MASESAIFTALPNGVHPRGDLLCLTVFVSPRLLTDGAGELKMSAGAFPAFSDWPATLAAARFAVHVDGVGPLPAESDPDSASPDSDTWHVLFDNTSVRDGTFNDRSNTRFTSFPVADSASYVLDLYTRIAEGFPEAFPPITTGPLHDLVSDLGSLSEDGRRRYYPLLENEFTTVHEGKNGRGWRFVDRSRFPTDSQGNRQPQYVFAEAYRFHDRPGARELSALDPPPPPPKPPEIDFHGFVAFCGDYPKLLRPLGIAVDLLLPFDPAIPPQGKLRVEIRDAPAAFLPWMTPESARPWTHYELGGRRFLAEPREKEGDLVDGMLRLEWEARFSVQQIDVDGSALKTVDFAGNVQRLNQHLAEQNGQSMSEDAAALPALRSSGFMIARDRRNTKLVVHLANAADHQDLHDADQPAELFAEDVNRGYRLDVEDQSRPGRWLSLHQRTGTYSLQQPNGTKTPLPSKIPADEGYVKGASTSAVPGKEDDQYLHEALFGWEGWSLAARRPGQAITNTAVAKPVPATEVENPYPMPLVTHFDATRGTLPRLRIGRRYRFRARAVDLAGNSVRDEEAIAKHATSPHTWRRWDPVPSPAVVPRRQFTEGESLMRMVIRSTLNVAPPDYVQLARVVGLAGHDTAPLAYLAINERHVAPAMGSQQLAEWHEKFDDAIGESKTGNDLNTQFDIAARESGSFLQAGPGVFVVNPIDPAHPTDLADPKRKKGDPLVSGEYVCHDVDLLALPYLPDPLSVGASFTSLPGAPDTWLQQWEPTAGNPPWYDRRPLRLRITDGSGPPVYDAAQRLLTVHLPQAEMVSVRLASYLRDSDVELFGPWMLQRAVFRGLGARRTAAAQGRNWMLTPWATLTLVHAVEKPLLGPEIVIPAPGVPNSGVRRAVGETFAVLSGVVQNHAKSTGRLDIEAEWTEPIDDINQPAPSTIDGRAHVVDFQLVASEDACRIDRNDEPATVGQPPKHRVRHEFRDTKHRNVTYRATATTRFREYFPPEITERPELITHTGPTVQLNVPSSRRPDPPDVLYVVPTWTWQQRIQPGLMRPGTRRKLAPTFLRTRTGGGLRVYMKRPWWSSGADELLGVVLEAQPWLTWPIDRAAKLGVSATAKAFADEFAERAFGEGVVKPAGPRQASATERLLAGVSRRVRRAKPLQLRANMPQPEATLLAHHAAVELTTAAEVARLSELAARFVLPSGDPQKFVTHWGQDPIWGSVPPLPGPYIHQFPLRVAVGSDISLLEAPGHDVTVVGHQPEYDPTRGLWYCDLQLDAGLSYFPFVKLALARYQPNSIPGQHLSKVVFPDFAQLVAERTAAFTRIDRRTVALSLRGPGAFTKAAADLTTDPANQLELSRFAVAQVERRPANATTDLAWVPLGDEVRLQLSAATLEDVRYHATVVVPEHARDDEIRVALREYEIFETDWSERDDVLIRPLSPTHLRLTTRPVKYRLVYADHLTL